MGAAPTTAPAPRRRARQDGDDDQDSQIQDVEQVKLLGVDHASPPFRRRTTPLSSGGG
jgi:hypothetical protein